MSTDKLHSTPNNDGGACSVHTTALITTDELLSKSMKQFTRRGSKSQLASEEVGVPQQRLDTNGTALKQQQQQKQLGSKTAVVASADPYSFDIEDNSASQKPSRAATEPSKPSAAAQQVCGEAGPPARKCHATLSTTTTFKCPRVSVCMARRPSQRSLATPSASQLPHHPQAQQRRSRTSRSQALPSRLAMRAPSM